MIASTSQVLEPKIVRAAEEAKDEDREFLRRSRSTALEVRGRLIRVVDLFSGCGGLSLGAKEACVRLGRPFVSSWAVDSEPQALKVYQENFSPKHSSSQDIRELLDGRLGQRATRRERSLLKAIGKKHDLVLAGPPCQGHSGLNNKTRHEDDRNKLYERVGRFVEIFRPQNVVIENVPTVKVGREGALENTLEHITGLGYCVDTEVVDLSQLGVPQRRKRHVVVASKARFVSISDIVDRYKVDPVRDLRWAIGDLEDSEKADSLFDRPARLSPKNRDRAQHLLQKELFDLPNELRPPCHQNDKHSYKSMYGRLSWDQPAQTITSGFGSPGQGRYLHPSKLRTLTPHEAARLQFFPDFFDFSSVETKGALARMIGNAVPPKLSMVFAQELLG